jgi:enamine deaminase RidA (YjgF/YER057c/UK114 family)
MVSAENQLKRLAIELPPPPTPLGAYVEVIQTGNLLYLSGVLPVEGHKSKYIGRIGKELDGNTGRKAAYAAALNVLAIAREYLGSLDKVSRMIKLGVFIATWGDDVDQPQVADGASELFKDVFGIDKMSTRIVMGVASLPLGVPIVLDVIFEIKNASV